MVGGAFHIGARLERSQSRRSAVAQLWFHSCALAVVNAAECIVDGHVGGLPRLCICLRHPGRLRLTSRGILRGGGILHTVCCSSCLAAARSEEALSNALGAGCCLSDHFSGAVGTTSPICCRSDASDIAAATLSSRFVIL